MKISDITSKKLLRIIDSNFYKKIDSFDKLKFYLSTLVKLICIENKVDAPQHIIFVDMPVKDLANYSTKLNTIFLNNRFKNIFEKCKQSNNNFYIYILVDSVLHELRHYFQNNESYTRISPIVKSFNNVYKLLRTHYNLKKLPYATNLIEIDARYYAYQVMNEAEIFNDYLSSAWFKKYELMSIKIGFPLAKMINDQQNSGHEELRALLDNLKSEYDSILLKNKINLNKFQKVCSDEEKSEKISLMEGLILYKSIAPDFITMNCNNKELENKKTKQAEKIKAWQNEFVMLYNENVENSSSIESENDK